MARYRVGNRYLSEEEYSEEVIWSWIFWIFVISSIVTGLLIYKYLVNPEWHQYIRFTVVVLPSIIVGIALSLLHKIIKYIIGVGFLIGVIYLIGALIMEFV